MIERFIPAGSTYAADIDNVILLIAVLVGFWFFLTLGMFFWLLWRYRHQEGQKAAYTGEHEDRIKKQLHLPHALIILCDIAIIIMAVNVWVNVKQTLPPPDATVRVIAQQWAWTFVHPGADGRLDTADDIRTVDELHVERGKVYHFELQSRDVLHSFSVPIFRLKQDAVPGRTIKGWFEATILGQYDIQCAEMCGIGHGLMPAQIHIETAEEHGAWVTRNTRAVAAVTPQ